jgi:hypothetical protein
VNLAMSRIFIMPAQPYCLQNIGKQLLLIRQPGKPVKSFCKSPALSYNTINPFHTTHFTQLAHTQHQTIKRRLNLTINPKGTQKRV